MTETLTEIALPPQFPDHTQLPESDGTFVLAERAEGKNFQEHSQSLILTESISSTSPNAGRVGIMAGNLPESTGTTLAALVGLK